MEGGGRTPRLSQECSLPGTALRKIIPHTSSTGIGVKQDDTASPSMIRTRRVHAEPSEEDGIRILVERLWPRGLSKQEARIDRWEKDPAPGNDLRQWFGHDPTKWEEFLRRYRAELEEKEEVIARLRREADGGTLLYAARDEEHNNAVALKRYIEETSNKPPE